ncbi:MAG: phage tail tape measure protein [Hyphomicrobium sp.]|nr:phage tail tape measure protein [Hyphomicrobium sp.]
MAVEVERLQVTLEANLTKYNAGMVAARTQTDRQLAAMESRFQQLSRNLKMSASSAATGVTTALGGISAAVGASAVIEYANAWTRLTRSLDGSEQAFGITLKSAGELTALANDARIDVESFAKTYTRAAAAVRDYGYTSNDAAKVTSTLAKALKLGQASASEQASTITQFSQALQKGKLDGDEFRTVMENAGIVQEILAQKLGVTKGKIIEMAAAGKLGIGTLVGAMIEAEKKIDKLFREMPQTVDEAFSVLRNNVIQYLGEADQANGVTRTLANGIQGIANNLDAVAIAAGAILASATLRMAAFAAATIGAANPLTLLAAALGALGAAYGVLGEKVSLSEDGLVSLRGAVSGFLDVIGGAEEVERFNIALDAMSEQQRKAAIEAKQHADAQRDANSVLGRIEQTARDATAALYDLSKSADRESGGALSGWIEGTKELASWIARLTGLTDLAAAGLDVMDQAAKRARNQALTEKAGKVQFGYGGALREQLQDVNLRPLQNVAAKPERSKFQSEVDQIKKRTEALQAEIATIGQSEFAQNKAKAAAELRFAAAQTAAKEGRKVSAEELAAIEMLSDAYAATAVKAAFLSKLQAAKDGAIQARQELDLLGLYGQELDAARAKLEMLNEAKRLGVTLKPERQKEIEATINAKTAAESYKRAIDDLKETSSDALKGFVQDLRDGKSASEALAGALDKLASKLIDAGIDNLVGSLVGNATKPGTGFASLFGFADGGIAANGRPVPLKRFANGGISNTAAIFGEAGPEAAIPLKGGKVPVDLRMPNIPNAVAGPSGATTVQVTVAPVFHVENGSPEGMTQLKNEIVPLIDKVARNAVHDLFDRSPRFSRSKL